MQVPELQSEVGLKQHVAHLDMGLATDPVGHTLATVAHSILLHCSGVGVGSASTTAVAVCLQQVSLAVTLHSCTRLATRSWQATIFSPPHLATLPSAEFLMSLRQNAQVFRERFLEAETKVKPGLLGREWLSW